MKRQAGRRWSERRARGGEGDEETIGCALGESRRVEESEDCLAALAQSGLACWPVCMRETAPELHICALQVPSSRHRDCRLQTARARPAHRPLPAWLPTTARCRRRRLWVATGRLRPRLRPRPRPRRPQPSHLLSTVRSVPADIEYGINA